MTQARGQQKEQLAESMGVTLPRTQKELLSRVKSLVSVSQEHLLPLEVGRGTNAPGDYLELLVGSRGGNRDIADAVGIEIKFHSGGGLLTLLHKEPHKEGKKSAVLPLVKEFGILNDRGQLSFRHTVNKNSPFRVVRQQGKIIVRPRAGSGTEVYWDENNLLVPCTSKLRNVVLVEGKIRNEGLNRYVSYTSARYLTDFFANEFLNHIISGYFLFDFDAREISPGGNSLRNHGTKLRMNVKDAEQIWGSITPHDSPDFLKKVKG